MNGTLPGYRTHLSLRLRVYRYNVYVTSINTTAPHCGPVESSLTIDDGRPRPPTLCLSLSWNTHFCVQPSLEIGSYLYVNIECRLNIELNTICLHLSSESEC